MSAQQTIDELAGMLCARALRYKMLAEGLYDRQTAAEASAYADKLEAEAERLADPRWPLGRRGWESPAAETATEAGEIGEA